MPIRLLAFGIALFISLFLVANSSAGDPQASGSAVQVDITGINKLANEGPNAIEWVAGPLSRAVPPGARSDILSLREMLRDEAAQGPPGNPAACKLGIKLCDLLLAALTDRETTIAKVQANDKTDVDASAQNFFDQSVTTAWTARANGIRTEAESVYDQFRTAARPSLAALHGQPAAGGQDTAAQRIFYEPPPDAAAQNDPSKPVVFSAGGGGPGDFQVISAFYGADKKKVDVSNVIRRHIADNELHMSESDWQFGSDPAPGKHKNLTIVYYANGEEKTYKFDHRQEISLP